MENIFQRALVTMSSTIRGALSVKSFKLLTLYWRILFSFCKKKNNKSKQNVMVNAVQYLEYIKYKLIYNVELCRLYL